MPTQVRFRRGTTAQNNNFTGAAGEISINTSNSTIRVHDGSTAGGTELATVTHVTSSIANVIGAAPAVLDTLNELATAIGNDPGFYANVASASGAARDQANTAYVAAVAAFNSGNTKVATVAGVTSTTISNVQLASGISQSGILTTANVTELNNLYFTNARVRSYLTSVDGNIVPASNITYDLGNTTHRFKDLWLSGTTINLGSIKLKETSGGLQVTNAADSVLFTASATSGVTSANGRTGSVTGLAETANGLSQFASTTSSALAGIMSDETGSGSLVFATTPTLVTPVLGLATGTSVMLSANIGAAAGNVSGNFTAGNFQSAGNVNTASILTTGSSTAGTFQTAGNVNSQNELVTGSLTAGTLQTAGNVNANNLRVVTNSSLGTVVSGTWQGTSIGTAYTDAKVTSVNGQTGAATGFATTANSLSQFASTTSAQLAGVISDETGSGALVFGTSPVLATPNIGTPTYAVLTSATGLPVSTGISGLGAGIATFLATPSATNLASAVTDETGSGALVFATTPTLVTPVLGLATGTSVMLSANVGAAAGNVSGNFTAGNFQTAGNVNAAAGRISGNFSTTGVLRVSDTTSATGAGTGAAIISGGASVGGNLYVGGNLFIAGTTTTLNSNVTILDDPIIYLADNSSSDVLDLGFVATFNNGTQQHTGFIRDASDGIYKLFANVIPEPNVNGTVDFTNATYSALTVGALTASSGTFSSTISATSSNVNTASALFTGSATAGTLQTAGNVNGNNLRVATNSSLGTVVQGTWQGTTIGTAYGGTGITSLGTGVATFLGTPSSSNLAAAVTDETGSGALVFATSPTLVTPILGTPQSGNFSTGTFTWPTFNQSTTGSAATLTTARAINGVSFNGSADITVTAAAGTLSGATLAAGVTASSLTSVGTLSSLAVTNNVSAGAFLTAGNSTAANFQTAGNVNSQNELVTGSITGGTIQTAGNVNSSSLRVTTASSLGTVQSGTWNGSSISTTYTDAKVTSVNGSTGAVTGLATTAGTLAQFGATTSSQLAGVISDETGSGALVFATSPTLTTPTLGVASATSVNKVAITAPATGSTLTIADGKTLTASNSLTFTGTDASSVAFGAGGTVLYSGGALGTPSSGTLTNCTFPTLNQNTTGTAAGLSTTLAVGSGGSGSTTAQGAMNTFAGAVTSGSYLRGNGTNVVMSAIQAGDVPTLNQSTTGSAATLTTARAINGVSFNGSADITVTAAAGTLSGATLAAGVTASSLTSVGTLSSLAVTNNVSAGAFLTSGSSTAGTFQTSGNVNSSSLRVTTASSLGTVQSGTWNGSSISTTYTDAKVTAVNAGTGITVNQTTGSLTVTNSGVTSATASTGISVSGATGGVTFTNTGVTSAIASTGISVSGATGGVTFTNTGVTSIVAGTNIAVSGATGAVTVSVTGTVSAATNATNVAITDDTATNSAHYPTFVSATSGNAGQKTSSTKLTFNPSSGLLTSTDYNSSSDERLKKDIKTIDGALDKVNSLRGVTFAWKDTEVNSMGLIAQEVAKVIPDVVTSDEAGTMGVKYNNLIGLLVEAIKEQQVQINDLKQQIEKLNG